MIWTLAQVCQKSELSNTYFFIIIIFLLSPIRCFHSHIFTQILGHDFANQ